MKILHIITSAQCWAGREQYAWNVAKAMIDQGDEVCFVVATDGDVVVPYYEQLGRVFRVELKSKFSNSTARELRKVIRTEEPDVIQTHQPKNIIHAVRARRGIKKDVAIVHTLHFVLRDASPRWLYRRIFSAPDRTIAVSELVRCRVMELYPSIPVDKVVTVLNSIDPKRVRSSQEALRAITPMTLGYAGRLEAEKGVHVLIDAMRLLAERGHDFRLLVAGVGSADYQGELKAQVSKANLSEKVDFMGFTDRIDEFIERLDFAVLPSVVSEAGSLMLLEYMCAGRAVITTDNGSQGEVIDDGLNGWLIKPDDAIELAHAIEKMLLSADKVRSMGCAAREKFEDKLSFEHFAMNTRLVYQEAIDTLKKDIKN